MNGSRRPQPFIDAHAKRLIDDWSLEKAMTTPSDASVAPFLPCICGAQVDADECPYPSSRAAPPDDRRQVFITECVNENCGWQALGWGADGSRKAWNTRARDLDAGKGAEWTDYDAKRLLQSWGKFIPQWGEGIRSMCAAMNDALARQSADGVEGVK